MLCGTAAAHAADAVTPAYAGGSTPITALLGQQIDLSVTTVPTAFTQIKAGNLRAYATVTRKRLVLLPDVPTTAEAGFADFEDRSWIAFFAPHKLALAMATRLNADINNVLATAEVKDRLAAIGLDAQITTQPEFAEYLTGEVAKWRASSRPSGWPRIDGELVTCGSAPIRTTTHTASVAEYFIACRFSPP